MFRAIGRLVKKVWKKIKRKATKIAKGVSKKKKAKKPKNNPEPIGTPSTDVTVDPVEQEQQRKTGSMAMKLVILTVIASGVYLSGFAAHPVGVPIAAALGGEIARTSSQIWSSE